MRADVTEADVIIVGGGPAGASCALKLHSAGARVLVLDQVTFPRAKPCAGWVTSEVFSLLSPYVTNYPHALTRFTKFSVSLRSFHFTLRVRQYAVTRTEFDAWLLASGGTEVINHQVRTITNDGKRYHIDGRFSCSHLVGAGGTTCPVYRTFFKGSGNRRPENLIAAREEEFSYSHDDAVCRLWFFQDKLPGYAWYVPKSDGIVNVGVGAKAQSLRQRGGSLTHHWDMLVDMLHTQGLVTGHAYRPSTRSYYIRQENLVIQKDQAFLVGDAAGLATRDMGEGIAPAIHSGLLAAEAILTGTPYQVKTVRKYSWPSICTSRWKSKDSL